LRAAGSHGVELAREIHNLAVWLNHLGRPDEALPLAEEAVALFGGERPALATALTNRYECLLALGRWEETAKAAGDVVAVRRELRQLAELAELADASAGRFELALALIKLGSALDAAERPDEAGAAMKEAQTLVGDLTRTDPGFCRDHFPPGFVEAVGELASGGGL
jgi:tetratricopeptide (TPR) repeat protein